MNKRLSKIFFNNITTYIFSVLAVILFSIYTVVTKCNDKNAILVGMLVVIVILVPLLVLKSGGGTTRRSKYGCFVGLL